VSRTDRLENGLWPGPLDVPVPKLDDPPISDKNM